MLTGLRIENEELRVQVRERDKQLQPVAVLTPTASETTPVTTPERDIATRSGRSLMLALLIGILLGIVMVMLFMHWR